jgi:mannose-6-phosphate isomerase-like protein (cupin superfamily)
VNEPRILRAGEGDVMGSAASCTDRFMVEDGDSGGRFSLVEHTIAPGALAAPMHMHTKEDEYSFVLEGTFAAILDGQEIEAKPGDLVFKPRGQWHTFWNPGRDRTRVLEIISPAGLEQFFRLVDAPETEQDPQRIAEMAAGIGCDVDEVATAALVERHGLRL